MRTASPKSGKEAEEYSSASFPRISEGDQIQSHLVAEYPVRLSGQAGDHQLAGGADDGLVQMPAEGAALLVTGAHVEVAVKAPSLVLMVPTRETIS